MELISVASLGWLLQIDPGCIFCNWYDVPGGPFGPLGGAAAGAAAAAAGATALNNILEEERFAEDIRREQLGPHGAHNAEQEGISDVSSALDNSRILPSDIDPPSPPGRATEI